MLASRLSAIVGAPVTDRTGLNGIFDAQLEWTPIESARSTSATEPVSLFAAIQEQLGLKLERGRGPIKVLVIDSVERPTPN